MKKKNPFKLVVVALLVIVALSGLGFLGYKYMPGIFTSSEQTGLPDIDTGLDSGVSTVSKGEYLCSQQPTVNGYFRVSDVESATNGYLANGTGYWVPHGDVTGSALVTQTAGADTTGSFSAAAATLVCGETYDLWLVDTANAQSYGVVKNIQVGTSPIYQTIKAHKTSALQARVKDASADAYWQIAGGVNTFSNLAATWLNTSAGATIDATSGGCHDLQLFVKTQTQDTVFGAADGEVMMLVDASTTKWDEPSTSLGNNVKDGANFDSYDLTAIADYEYAYKMNQIKDTQSSIDFYECAVSGVDPGAADDVKIRFVAKGAVLDSKSPDLVRVGYFGNGATYAEIQGTTEEITIDEVA